MWHNYTGQHNNNLGQHRKIIYWATCQVRRWWRHMKCCSIGDKTGTKWQICISWIPRIMQETQSRHNEAKKKWINHIMKGPKTRTFDKLLAMEQSTIAQLKENIKRMERRKSWRKVLTWPFQTREANNRNWSQKSIKSQKNWEEWE